MRIAVLLAALALYAAQGEYKVVEKQGRWWLADPSGRISFYALESCTEIVLPEHLDVFAGKLPPLKVERAACWTPPAGTLPWVSAIRSAGSDTEGKQMYIMFLKEKYGYNIGRVNAAYGLEASAFTDLAESNLRTLDTGRPAVTQDDAEFGNLLIAQAAGMIRQRIPRSSLFMIRTSMATLAPHATALIIEQDADQWPDTPIIVRVRQSSRGLIDRIVRHPHVIGAEAPSDFVESVRSRLDRPAVP
jgi:hypothetical protein